MKYDVIYNRARNIYMVWRNGSEVVKTFKTLEAAERWIKRQH